MAKIEVILPNLLNAYTNGENHLHLEAKTLGEVMRSLNQRFPGIYFRMIDERDTIREHILMVVNRERADTLDFDLADGDSIRIVAAISGG